MAWIGQVMDVLLIAGGAWRRIEHLEAIQCWAHRIREPEKRRYANGD